MFRGIALRAVFTCVLGITATCGLARGEETKASGKTVIPVFRLHGAYTESGGDDSFSLGGESTTPLRDLIAKLKKAAKDPAVKAVVLLCDSPGLGGAQIEEVRQALEGIKAAGKEIYAHADSADMKNYVLLSAATRISLVPTSDLWITGLHGESPYLRGLLDKLGVKPQFLTCGEYKSASEIFMREGPSPEADKMQNWLLDSLFETDLKLIASGRKVDAAKAKEWINNAPYSAERAKSAGIIDAVEHRQDVENLLRSKYGKDAVLERKYGKKKPAKVDLSNPFAMFKIVGDLLNEGKKKDSSKPAIAVVYVDGAIDIGGSRSAFGGNEGASAFEIRKALEECARDDAIKAVVLRVDSPGGSATASEIIFDATRRVKAKKPFVVSMGDVAGSGGYYVACAADTVFADASTITGSIGVVGGKMVTTGMWNKIGINFKEYKRGENAGLLSSSDIWTPGERQRMQGWMDEIYGVFKGHVVAIRGSKLKKPIDELAGGRVYTGAQALELGLVDKIGTLEDALAFAAGIAKIKDYELRVVPEPKNFFEQILEELMGDKDEPNRLVRAARPLSLIELASPALEHMDRNRVKAVYRALGHLEMLHRDGVVLTMPEFRVGR